MNNLDIDLQNMTDIEKSALISKLDYEITKEVLNGHKSVIGDKFQNAQKHYIRTTKRIIS